MYLGLVWVVLQPLLQVAIYVFVIAVILRVRFPGGSGGFDYAVYVLGGMVPWLILARTLEEAPSMIQEKVALLKQVVYPIETIPLIRLTYHGVGLVAGFVFYFVLAAIAGKAMWTWLLLPLPLVLIAFFLLGMSWILMLVGVVLKDIKAILGVLMGMLIFASPVLLAERMVTANVWFIIQFNPLTHFIVPVRDVLEGSFHPHNWIIAVLLTVLATLLGAWLVNRTKLTIREYI